jgi:flagellar motor switch protein FliM
MTTDKQSRKLTDDEVNALVRGLEKQQDLATTPDRDIIVREFVFGSDDLTLLGDYYALKVINERFARLARSVFQPMLRLQPRISAFPPKVMTFDEYSESVNSFMSLTTTRIEELRGSQLMVISPDFISLLTNAYYGGKLTLKAPKRNDFTNTETRVIEVLTNGLNRALSTAWQDLMPITFKEPSREENLQFASFVDGDETVISCSFIVQLPDVDPATFDILYPLQTLKPIAAQLRSRMQSDVIDDNVSWRQRLERALLRVPLDVTVELSRSRLSLQRFLTMTDGDIIPIHVEETLRTMVASHHMFDAVIGNVDEKRAINVTRRIED